MQTNASHNIYVSPCGLDIRQEIAHAEPRIYPNPSPGLFAVELPGNSAATITVFDEIGKIILIQTIDSHTTRNITVDIRSMAVGNYTLKISMDSSIYHYKIVRF